MSKKPIRSKLWRVALNSTAAYYPVFVPHLFAPLLLRGGEWGDVYWPGMLEAWMLSPTNTAAALPVTSNP